jgi:hypothetical protein
MLGGIVKIRIFLLIVLGAMSIVEAVEIAPKSPSIQPARYLGLVSLGPYFGHHHACNYDSTSGFGLRVSMLEFAFFPRNSRFGFGFKAVDVVSHSGYESYFSGLAPNISYVVYADEKSFQLLTAQIALFIDWFSYALDYSYVAIPPLPVALNARIGRTKLFN